MIQDRGFYRRRRVLVTGHTGFKGTWLTTWLHRMGAVVTGFSLPPEGCEGRLFRESGLEREIVSVAGDVRDAAAVKEVFATAQPEIVFHLAAQPLVRASYRDPLTTYSVNVLGTASVLEAMRHTESVRAGVIVTTDKCYENREWIWPYRECDPLGGYDPYSSSKACAEIVTAAYRQSYFDSANAPQVASVRAGNVIGGGDWSEDRLVPDVARAIAADREIVIRSPGAVRPWQHVLEPLHGYLLVGERLCQSGAPFAGAWNFGPETGLQVSVGELVQRIVNCWGTGRLVLGTETRAPHEANLLTLDSSKARTQLGWKPLLSVEQTVAWTVEWYREYCRDSQEGQRLLVQQIEDFELLSRPSAQVTRVSRIAA